MNRYITWEGMAMGRILDRLLPKSISIKIYLSIVLTGGILVIAIGIILSFTLKTKFVDDFTRIQENQAKQFVNTFDIHLKNINATVRNVAEYSKVKKLLSGKYTQFESYVIYRDIYSYIDNIKEFDNWKDIYIFPSHTSTLLTTNKRHITSNYHKYGIDLAGFHKDNRDIDYIDNISIGGSDAGVGIALRVRDILSMQVTGNIIVFMNESILYDTLRDTNWSDHDLMAVVNDKGEIVYSSNREILKELGKTKVVQAVEAVEGKGIEIRGDNRKKYHVFMSKSRVSEFSVISFADKTLIYRELNKLQAIIVCIVTGCMIILLLLGKKTISFFTKPINKLTRLMRDAEKNNYNKLLNIEINNETRALAQSFNKMMLDIRENQILKNQSQIDALQKQINPHFLFNTLESIKVLAYTRDYSMIIEMIQRLSTMFRYTMNRENQKTTTIDNELEHVKNYLGIQQVRFSDKLSVRYDIDPHILDKQTLKFILQPIVENSIVHGLENAVRDFTICISAYEKNGDIIFEIADNGTGIKSERLAEINAMLANPSKYSGSTGIGLKNISERLQLYYGETYKLEINSGLHAKTVVTVRIPSRQDDGNV